MRYQSKFPLSFQKETFPVCWTALSTVTWDLKGPQPMVTCDAGAGCKAAQCGWDGSWPHSCSWSLPLSVVFPSVSCPPILLLQLWKQMVLEGDKGFPFMLCQCLPNTLQEHFSDRDTPSSSSSYRFSQSSVTTAQVTGVDQQNAAQCYFHVNSKSSTSYPGSSLSPQALEDKNHPPVKQKVWCDFSITCHTKGLRPMKMSPYWLHTNVYSSFCLYTERCFAFSIEQWDLLQTPNQISDGNYHHHSTVKTVLSYWFTSAWDLICYS